MQRAGVRRLIVMSSSLVDTNGGWFSSLLSRTLLRHAAGDGVVTRAGSVSGYGNYVEIEHNAQYATAYGHLSAFAHGLHEGERVRQGEVIGYVGMSGMATGPHLHYEVHYQGTQIDPLSVRMPATTRLAGDDLKAFEAERDRIERQLLEGRQHLVAHAVCPADGC